ncbi:helix-turn-helix domain-containing protein [Larkinella terrae]|uniref:Helix-turn-helix domain-containing protein n=1 Tax=Larkinella terrae TaxID=2025311 RepID=A0A7K0ET10_9BACT|nr:helix-turn-helix domain-containing protein [Larkinella terrae]MRS64651.1 helix-turn-helix domain-containing protein [Larkinella terrae]
MNAPENEKEYRELMARIEVFLQKATAGKGFSGLTSEEADELAQLSQLAENYEDAIPLMPIKMPQSLVEMIEFKMYEKRLKQREMAQLLEIPETRLSEIIRGKRRINLEVAKRLYTKFGIDPAFILQHA